eukprot:scaffold106323_cov28-Tisochrysis_lutea.AAC.4
MQRMRGGAPLPTLHTCSTSPGWSSRCIPSVCTAGRSRKPRACRTPASTCPCCRRILPSL